MAGKVCMVTGATSGIGQATAQALAALGATVIVIGRDEEKAKATVARIRAATGRSTVEWLLADLSIQSQVRGLAQAFQRSYPRLDVLVNNAGGIFARRRESADGVEMSLALNLLSPFLLTNLLLQTLGASTPARIVNLSSIMEKRARIDFEDLEGRKRYNVARAYGQSKLATLLFTYELGRRLAGTGISVNAVHPGIVATGIGTGNGWLRKIVVALMRHVVLSPEEGAQTSVYLAASPEIEGVTGKYFIRKETVASSPASYDEVAAKRLWDVCEEMTGLKAEEPDG